MIVSDEAGEGEFYIVDLRADWTRQPYVTLWRPNNANYAWPLPWAGKYTRAKVDEGGGYYAKVRYGTKRTFDRFPVPAAVVERLAVHSPRPGDIDGNAGPVLLNDKATRAALRRAKYLPPSVRAHILTQGSKP